MRNINIDLKKDIAENVKRTYTAAGDKASDMAKRLGREPAYFSRHLNTENERYENTIFNLWDLADIADAYKVTLSSLVTRPKDEETLTLADLCQAIRILDKFLGLSITDEGDGRPKLSFQYSGLDDFLQQYGKLSALLDKDPNLESALLPAINQLIKNERNKPAAIYSVKGLREGKSNALPLMATMPPEGETADLEAISRNFSELSKEYIKKALVYINHVSKEETKENIDYINFIVPDDKAPGPYSNKIAACKCWLETLLAYECGPDQNGFFEAPALPPAEIQKRLQQK